MSTMAVQAAPWRATSRRSGDVDEHAASLSGWRQDYDQLGRGRFDGRLDEVVGQGVQLFRECTSQQLRQRCEVWPGALWLGVTEADDGSRLDGRRVGAGGVMHSGRDGAFELVSPAGHAIVGLVVAGDVLARHAPGLPLPEDAGAGWWTVSPAVRHGVLVKARAILALAAGGGGAAQPLQAAMLDLVAGLLATRRPPPPERGNAASRRRLVARVHEHVAATPERVPGVAELCAALHVSRRTLQYAFEEEAGTTPLAFLRSVRLNGVRRLLRAAAPGQTVQGAAAAWGFCNPSAFAAEYRRQFGECASETLARSRAVS